MEAAPWINMRECSTMAQTYQTLSSWGEYLASFNPVSGSNCIGRRSGGNQQSGPICRRFRDTCLPIYMPTAILPIEHNRQSMELALLGQFSVVLFRAVTGHVGGTVLGLVVFVAGNQARCSLQNSSLTTYVALGMTMGLLDSYALLLNMITCGPGFFVLPLQPNLFQDIEALSMVLAPVSEILGAQLAWQSYLTPEHLMLRPDSGDMCFGMHRPWMSPPLGLQPSGWPPQREASWFPWIDSSQSTMPWQGGSSPSGQWPGQAYSYNSPPRIRRSSAGTGSDHDGYTAGSGEPGVDSACEWQQCDECGKEVDTMWTGTGSYASHVYCSDCWNSWKVS